MGYEFSGPMVLEFQGRLENVNARREVIQLYVAQASSGHIQNADKVSPTEWPQSAFKDDGPVQPTNYLELRVVAENLHYLPI